MQSVYPCLLFTDFVHFDWFRWLKQWSFCHNEKLIFECDTISMLILAIDDDFASYYGKYESKVHIIHWIQLPPAIELCTNRFEEHV